MANFVNQGESRVEVDPPATADPIVLSFDVQATDVGPGSVWVIFRQGVAPMRTVERDGPVPVSVSIGLVAWPDDGTTLDQLMDGVDESMYAAKQRGRNRIGGPYTGAGEMTPVMLPASPVAVRRARVSISREMGRAG